MGAIQRVLFGIGLTSVLPSMVLPQASAVIDGTPRCSRCAITFGPMVTMGESDGGPGEIAKTVRRVDASPWGSFLVSFFDDGELIAEFDKEGRFLRRIGRANGGPTEFREPFVVGFQGDTVTIIDRGHSRLVRHYRGLSLAAPSILVPQLAWGPLDAVLLSDGSIVANLIILRSADLGYPLHLFSKDGSVQRVFGATIPEYRPDRPALAWRALAPAANGRFWAGHRQRHVFEEYGPDGTLLRSIRVNSAWFPEGDGSYEGPQPGGSPMKVMLADLWVDPGGLLWAVVSVPDRRWESAFGPVKTLRSGRRFYPIDDWTRLGDTMLEVIDPNAGVVLATRRVPEMMGSIDAAGYTANMASDESGLLRVQARQVHLSRSR